MGYTIFIILYVIFGLILAVPYCLLAGWSPEHYLMVSVLAPAFSFFWFLWASLSGIIDFRRYGGFNSFNWRKFLGFQKPKEVDGSLIVLWIWTLFILLPVIFHWAAKVLHQFGQEAIASLLETYRYASTVYALFATLVIILIYMLVKTIWLKTKNA